MKESIKHGEVIGYEITCGRHTNAHDSIPCGKHLAFGTDPATRLTPDECMRRLKRWYLTAPHKEHEWPPESARDAHVRGWGGRRLQDFASNLDPWPSLSDANLDDMVIQVEPVA